MNNLSNAQLRENNELAHQYLNDRLNKGYSKADIAREILAESKKQGEAVTEQAIKSWVKREANKLDKPKKIINKKTSNTNMPKSIGTKTVHKEVDEMSDKLDKIIDMLENKQKNVEASGTLTINFNEEERKAVHTSMIINEKAWKQFNEFCKNFNFKKKDLISKALIEFMEKYDQ